MSSPENVPVRGLLSARLITFCRYAPWGNRVPSPGCPALATTMGVIDGVHRHPSDRGSSAQPSDSACLSVRNVLMIQVSDLADRRFTIQMDEAYLPGRQADVGVISLLREELGHRPSRSDKLGSLTRLELDIVDEGSQRDRPEGQRVSRLDVHVVTGYHPIARLDPVRGQNVALLPVCIMEKGDLGGTVRIVFHGRYPSWDVQLVPLEVDESIPSLVTSSPVSACDPSSTVSSTGFCKASNEGLLGF